jgi:exopolysaccharide production protein ExoQ
MPTIADVSRPSRESPQRTYRWARPLWPVVLPILLMLASDYKLRMRDRTQAVAGNPDLTILVEVAIYGLAALFLYRRFGLRPPGRRPSTLALLAWIFVGYVALSATWSPYHQMAAVRGTQLLITAALSYTLATRATTADLHRLAHAFVVVVLLSIGIGVAHNFGRTPETAHRFNWLYVHPVTAAIYLAIAVLVVASYLTRRGDPSTRRWSTSAYSLALLVLAGALIATGTRGAAIGCAVGLLVLLSTARGPRGRVEMIVMAIPTLVIVALALSTRIVDFWTRGETEVQLHTLNQRTKLWSLAIDAFGERPLFGRGMSASRGLFLEELGLGGGHNAFVNILLEGGIVGLLIFVLLITEMGVRLAALTRVRARRTDAAMLLGILIMLIIDGMTAEMMAAAANVASVWLFISIAWIQILQRPAAAADTEQPPMHHALDGSYR